MDDLEIALAALDSIANFGHALNCQSSAPIHECCCYTMSEQDIARKALQVINEART